MSVNFTETNLIPNAGLLPAAMLAQRIDLAGLVDQRLQLARHGAGSGSKALTVIGSVLAGGDSIDDTAVLRAGAAGILFDDTRAPVDDRVVAAGAQVVPTSGSTTRSAASCWPGCGQPVPARPT